MKRTTEQAKKEDDPSRDVLRAIYRADGTGPDLRRLERKPRNRRKRFLFLLVLFLVIAGALAVAGMLLFSPENDFSGEQVAIVFDGADGAATGDEYVLSVSVENKGRVGLRKLELTIRYPEGFQFVSSSPKPSNEFSNVWRLDTLGAGDTETVRIVGKLIGELGSEKIFSATANYEPANFASQFTAEEVFTTHISASALELEVRAPRAATNGQEVTYEIEAKNAGDETIDRVRLTLEFPAGLTDMSTDPKPTEGSREWDRVNLKKGESFTVTVKGTLKGDPKSTTELKAALGILDGSSTFLTQREKSALVLILESTLNLRLLSNDKETGVPVDPRAEIPIRIAYSNDSDSDFTNATIELLYAGDDSDDASVELVEHGGVTSTVSFAKDQSAPRIRWTKDDLPDLARLVPGKSGTIDVTLPLKGNLRSLGSGLNLALTVQATAKAENIGDTGSSYEAKSNALTFPVNTELRLAVEGRYFSEEGVMLGSGPLPPEVGLTTTYVIQWYLTNTLNGVTNALIKATLPEGATFVSAETTGGNNISYDTTTREVRWRIDKIDARVGQTLPTLVGSFRVSVTPVDGDVGKTLPLAGKTTLDATDAFTASVVSLTGGAVSTELENDIEAKGKGTVVAPTTNTNSATNAVNGS